MARPLREQFVLATLALLVPVTAVLTWAGSQTYAAQLNQLRGEVETLAAAIAAHIDQTGLEDPAALAPFLARLPATARVVVSDAAGRPVAVHPAGAGAPAEELTRVERPAGPRSWTVDVGMSTRLAWDRSVSLVRQAVTVTVLATLVVFMLEVLLVRRLLRAFVSLERSADRVGRGDLSALPAVPMPTRELEHVHAALRDMVDRLREAHEAIARQVEEERRMRREVETLQQQVIRQERLAAIGLLLSGIAHELNNPLQAISGFAELLQRDRDIREDVRQDLALMQKESARASSIIRNLSRFSRQDPTRASYVLLTDVVASVVELRQRRMQEQGVRLEVDDRASKPVTAVLAELQQVLLNFVVNAEHAVSSRPVADRRIIIRTSDTGDGVRMEVEDTGPGVPTEDESKLFQPFFTTKPIGEGTGLGLSVSYGIVQTFGGTIGYARGALGGARFWMELPSPALEARRA